MIDSSPWLRYHVAMENKKCSKCGETQSIDNFGMRGGKQSHLRKSWCKSCLAALRSKNYQNNPEREAEQNRRWHQENKPWLDPKRREYHNAWRRASNRRAEWANRDALKRGAEGSFSNEEWVALCEKYGNRCLRCGRGDVTLSVDHVKPLSKGGTNWLDNIQPLCVSCNCSKGATEIDYREGWTLSESC